eukprot:7259282-Karenia_brevis.AAC.1
MPDQPLGGIVGRSWTVIIRKFSGELFALVFRQEGPHEIRSLELYLAKLAIGTDSVGILVTRLLLTEVLQEISDLFGLAKPKSAETYDLTFAN